MTKRELSLKLMRIEEFSQRYFDETCFPTPGKRSTCKHLLQIQSSPFPQAGGRYTSSTKSGNSGASPSRRQALPSSVRVTK